MRKSPFTSDGDRPAAASASGPGGAHPAGTGAGAIPALEDSLRVRGDGTEEVIPIAEEVVRVGKRETVTGTLRVHTHVDVETEMVRAALATDSVEVTRVPVDRPVDHMPDVRTENGVTIVPVVEEVLFVEKRLVLKEELHIRRATRNEDVEVPVEIRKHRVEIERVPAADERDAGK